MGTWQARNDDEIYLMSLMFGVLQLTFGKIEVELGNDECNGHILNRWHKLFWFTTLYYFLWRNP